MEKDIKCNSKILITLIALIIFFSLVIFSCVTFSHDIVSNETVSAASARWVQDGSARNISAFTPGGITVFAGTNTSEISASNFWVYADSGSSSDFKWMNESAFGYQDFDCGSDKAFVYFLQVNFTSDLLTAVGQGRVSAYFYCESKFDDGINDESGAMFQEILPSDATPTNAWVSDSRGGDSASWSTTTNARHAPGWSNGDGNRVVSWGEQNYSSSYCISTNATGVRLVFGAISDSKLDGGFKSITLKFYTNLYNNITVNNSSYGSVNPTSVTASTSSTSNTVTATPKDGYIFSSWTKNGFVSTPSSTVSDSSGTITITGAQMKPTSNAVANFTAITYTIVFNMNYPTGSSGGTKPANQTVQGNAKTSALGSATLTNYLFAGWMLDDKATSPDYYEDGSFYPYSVDRSKSASITIPLYALWQASTPSYLGDLTSSNTQVRNIENNSSAYRMYDDLKITTTATKNGQTLAGIYATYTSGDINGQTIALEKSGNNWILYGVCGNFNLSAKWAANVYTITFNANSGTAVSSQKYVYGTQQYLPTTTRSNYNFSGWKITSTNGNTSTSSAIMKIPSNQYGDITLTAQWKSTNINTSSSWSVDLGTWMYAVHKNKTKQNSTEDIYVTGRYMSGSTNYWSYLDDASEPSTPSGGGIGLYTHRNKYSMQSNTAYNQFIFLPIDVTKIAQDGVKITGVSLTANSWFFAAIDDEWAWYKYYCKTQGWIGIGYSSTYYSDTTSTIATNTAAYDFCNGSSVSYVSLGDEINSGNQTDEWSYNVNRGDVSHSVSGKSWTSGYVYIVVKAFFDNNSPEYGAGCVMLRNCNVTFTLSNNTKYTATLNANGGTIAGSGGTSVATYYASSSATVNGACVREGYYFDGWSTSKTATSGSNSISPTTSGQTYYAVWKKNQYPVITYDVFYDGTNRCVSIRKEWYSEYNGSVSLNKGSASTSSYTGTNMYPKAGGNTTDYVGFNPGDTYKINTKPSNSRTWGYAAGTSATSITSISSAVWGYYVWNMKNPEATKDNPTVTYGSSIDLRSYIYPTHEDSRATLSLGSWTFGNGAKTFYTSGVPIIYAVDETGVYGYTITATLTRSSSTTGSTVTFTKTQVSTTENSVSATISPIYLKLNAPANALSLTYNGQVQEFAFTTTVDSGKHTGSALTAAESVFNTERDLGSGHPWYYNADGSNTEYWSGVIIDLTGLGYTSRLGASYYTQTSNVFKDAGTYWVNNIIIKRYLGGVKQADSNTNYKWTTSNSQTISAGAYNSTGTVSATIKPINGFNTYAFYVYKTFGIVVDPSVTAINMSEEDFEDNKSDYLGTNANNSWFLGIEGMLGVDFNEYGDDIALGLVRDTSASLYNSAGKYNVTFTVSPSTFPAVILNNYNCSVSAENYTYLSTSHITMYFLDESGTKISNTGYAFTQTPTWANYGQTHNNFEIVPRPVSMAYNGQTEWEYDGDPHGPNYVVTNGLLNQSQQNAFSNNDYNVYFNLYFYGIPTPSNWGQLNATQKNQYVENHKSEKVIVGSGNRIYVTGISDNYVQFLETSAGTYGVIVVDTAYKDAQNNYHPNPNYAIPASPGYYAYTWTITKVTLAPNVAKTTTTFGGINYGGFGFTFSRIVTGDAIKLTVVTTYKGNSSNGFIRYSGLTSNTSVTNGSYLNYGTHEGYYKSIISVPVTIPTPSSSGLYGNPYETSYMLGGTGVYDTDITIAPRTISQEIKYTTDSGANYSLSSPTASNWIYQYGVSKGVKIKLSNFYDSGFITGDITYWTLNKTEEERGKITIRSDVLLNQYNITINKSLSTSPAPTETIVERTTEETGSVTYTFFGINASNQNYNVTFNAATSIAYSQNNVAYANYKLESVIDVNFKISPKTIKLDWILDGETAVNDNNPFIIYDARSHTVAASLRRGTSGSITNNDYNVYYSDYISATSLYTEYNASKQASLSYTGNSPVINVGEYTAFVTQLSGNYTISTDENTPTSRKLVWEIKRRSFTMYADPATVGDSYYYDGTAKEIPLVLDGSGVTVNISDFSANVQGVAGVHFTMTSGLSYNSSSKKFGATNVGRYEFSYNAGDDGIEVETNWLLTGSRSYTYLFVIVPQVITFSWNTLSAIYTSNNLISIFTPTITNSNLAGINLNDSNSSGIVLSFNLNSIIHVGSYTVSVTGKSGNDNYVLAGTSEASAWEPYKIESNYYLNNSAAEATYSKTVTVNPYTITLPTSSLNAQLSNYTYDGNTHGYALSTFYDVIKTDMLTNDDKAGYSLIGTSGTGKNVGNYIVSITGFNPYNGHTDYVLSESYNNTWSITAKALSVTYTEYHSAGSTYDYDGNEHGYTLALSGLVSGESLKIYFSRTNTIVRGMDGVVSPDNDNDLTISAGGYAYIYGVNAGSYSISAFTIGNKTIDAITYLASNYNLPNTGFDKTWTIVQRTITVSWSNLSLTYRASQYTPQNGGVYATVSNMVTGDTLSVTYGGTSTATNAGTYSVSVTNITGASNANYKIEGTLSNTWTINRKEVTLSSSLITWKIEGTNSLSIAYDGANHRAVATATSGATLANDGKVYASDFSTFAFTYSSTSPYVTTALVRGTYQSAISGCNNNNYTVVSGNASSTSWEITRRSLTVSVTNDGGNASFTYDASTHGLTVLISGFIATDYSNDYIAFTFTSTAATDNGGSLPTTTSYSRIFRSTNYGSYSVSVAIDSTKSRADCYTLTGTTSGSFSITKRVVELSWDLSGANQFSVVYDGTAHVLSATVTNKANEADIVTIAVSNGTNTNVGNYTGTASSVSNTNYTLTGAQNTTRTYSITARPLSASWVTGDYTYNGLYQGNSLSISNLIAADSLTFTISFYTGGYSGTLIKTSTITKTGNTTASISASDFEATVDYGTYYAILSTVLKTGNAVNSNYSFTPVANSDRTSYDIAKKTLTLSGTWTWSNGLNSGTYGNSTHLVYNKAVYTLTTTIANNAACTRLGVLDSLTLNYTGNVATNVSNGETATVSSISGTYANNYVLPAEKTKGYVIYPKEVAIVWANYTGIVYDGANHTVTASITSGATTNTDGKSYTGDTVTVTAITNQTKRDAGNYTATATTLSNSNYTIGTGAYCAGNASLNFTIAQRPVSLTWSATNIEYDGTAKTITAVMSNLVEGDIVTFTYSNNSKTSVGDYTASVTALSGTSAGNYTLTGGTNVSHVWHITPIILGFSWSGGANLVYNKSGQGVLLTITRIAAADLNNTSKISFTTANGVTANHDASVYSISFTAVNAGSYTANVTAITGTSAANYSLPDVTSRAFTISPRVITVNWTSSNQTYKAASYNAVAAVSNLCSEDSCTLTYNTRGNGTSYNVTGAAGTGNIATHADTYTTTITGVSNNNYTITGATGLSTSWTISPKALTQFSYLLDGANTFSVTYNGSAHVITASVTSAATTTSDGKTYTGDTVTLGYSGSIRTNVGGISSITNNSATNAGSYRVNVSSTGNSDYSVSSQYIDFEITTRTLTVTITNTPNDATFVYNKQAQGKRVTIGNIIAGDNDNTNLILNPSFNGTVSDTTRNGTTMYRDFTGINAGSYSGSATLSGTKNPNYILASAVNISFTISPKEISTAIVVNTTNNTFTYAARAITANDLGVSFTTLVTGEALTTSDYAVTYKNSSDVVLNSAPSNVGSYKAVISLNSTATSNNYTLVGTTQFDFSIITYKITTSMLTWSLGGNTVTLDTLVFEEDENKTITATVSDAVYSTISGKSLSYRYFGFCNGALNQTKAQFDADAEHTDHQWLLDNGNLRTTGPEHAGSYWVVITLSGADSANFEFTGFTGYSDTTHFYTTNGNTYLTYYNDSSNYAISSALPVLGNNVACLSFGINRAELGFITNPTPSSLPFKGSYYYPQAGELPYITSQSQGSDIRVQVNSTEYSYAAYVASDLVRNAGTYNIKIYDANASGQTVVTGCDYFSSGAILESNTELTVTKSKITILDNRTDANAWKKEYNKQTLFDSYTYTTGVTFDPDEVTDGVISGTDLTISAAYDSYNAGNRTITFTFGGADAQNYYAVFTTSESTISNNDVTIVGNTYSIGGVITPRVVTVMSSATKVYDGTTALVPFEITSMSVVSGDDVRVTGTFASANVGTWAISITTGNPNYVISANIAATGIITPKPLEFNWTTTNANATYDKQSHGVSLQIVGMVADHEEDITVTGVGVASTTITAGTSSASYSAVNAGTYSVSLALGNNSNYSVSSAITYQTWTISQRELTISWTKDNLADGNHIYGWVGNSVVYSAVERQVTPSISAGLIQGDVVNLTVVNNISTNVISLVAEVTNLTGADSANYVLPADPTLSWSITAATIVGVTISNVNAVYNHAAQGPEVNTYVTQHNIALNAVYSGGTTKTANTIEGNNARIDVGSSTISVTLSAANYTNLVLNATVTISKATVTGVVMDNVNTTYDSTAKSVTVNRTTTQFNENITVTYTISTDNENFVSGNSKTNAGLYYVKATCNAGNNYNNFELNATLTIAKADILASRITVAEDFGTFTYDANYHGVIITVTDNETQYGEAVTITYYGGQTGGTAKDVGTYHINAVVSAGDNYNNFTTSASTLTIQAKEIDISYQEATFTYNGNVQTPSVTINSGIYPADTSLVTLTVNVLGTSGEANGDTVFKDAGTYRLTPSLDNANYKFKVAQSYKDYTVNQATITGYYFVSNTVDYNGQVRYLGVNSDNVAYMTNVQNVALLATDIASVTYKYNTTAIDSSYVDTFNGVTYAGTYYIQATINAGGNYAAWSRTATLVINQVSLSGFSLANYVTTYDGSVKTLSVTVDNPSLYNNGVYSTVQGDTLTLTYTISSNNGSTYTSGNSATNVNIINSEVAPYKVRLVFSVPAAATSSYIASSFTMNADLTINKAALSNISFSGGTYVYDGNAHNVTPSVSSPGGYPQYSLNGAKTELTVILSASHNGGDGDTFTVTQTVDQGVSAINVGSYNFRLGITPLSANPNNYITFAGLTSTVTITPATMSTSAGVALLQDTNIFFGNDDLEFTYDSYTHYVVLATTQNQSILTTDSNNVVNTFTVYPSTNTSHSDSVAVIYTVNSIAASGVHDVGEYEIIATLTDGNYSPVTLSCTVIVDKATINYYFVGNNSLIYDTNTHFAGVNSTNAYLNDGTITQIHLAGTDLATVAYTYTSTNNGYGSFTGATNADTYVITATITVSGGAGGNYYYWDSTNEDNDKTVNLVISPYSTAVTWVNENQAFTYNGENKAGIIGASFTAANSNTIQMEIQYLGTSGKADGDTIFKNAGTYTVTAIYDSPTAYNYNFTTATTKQVSIAKANVDYYLVGSSITYDGATHYLNVNSDNASNVSTTNITSINPYALDSISIVYTYAKQGAVHDSYYNGEETVELTYGARNAGTYTVTADINLGEGESNYNDWDNPKQAVLTITKINITQTGGTFTKVYDGTTAIANIGTLSGIIVADQSYLVTSGTFDNKNVGTNKQIIFSLTPSTNYEYLIDNYILPSSVRGTITQKALTVSQLLDDWDKPYDGTTSSPLNPLTITTSNGLILGDDIVVNAVYNSKNVLEADEVSFTISGADAGNYSLATLDFSGDVDFSTVYLITPLSADIRWSTDEVDYNGREQQISATVDVYGEDAEGTDGTLSLTLAISRTKDGDGNNLNPIESNATFRNAGTYSVTASSGSLDANFIANYGISSTAHTYIINKATRSVSWSGLLSTYEYNGENQGVGITASVTLLGNDVQTYAQTDYLSITITSGGNSAIFKDAGDYSLTATLTVAILNNNYTLANQYYERTIEKADITNIDFSGSYSWTYYAGETNYFFVVASGGTYARYQSGEFNITTSFNYPFDATPMPIVYAGGEVSHANVTGLNGIKNVNTSGGSYTISASVEANTNYNSWNGSITVTVNKGTIDNIVMADLTFVYDGTVKYLYAFNGSLNSGAEGRSTFTQITTPDGENVNIEYSTSINQYKYNGYQVAYSVPYNRATNAGTYAVTGRITNHRNYNNFTVPNVNSSLGTSVILEIGQRNVDITWEYNNEAEPDFTYNATNQASTVRGRILRVDGNNPDFYLSMACQLNDEINIDNALKTEFVVAGHYTFTASMPNPQEGLNEYAFLMNNYVLNNPTSNVTMKKFTVSIVWRYMTDHTGQGNPAVYDSENPCVYDRTTHGVTAQGLGINDVAMTIITSGTFSAVNAGQYEADVDSIAEGTDSLVLNATTYYIPYSLNYQLADNELVWTIARRPVTLEFDGEVSKIYDGSKYFNFEEGDPVITIDGLTRVVTWTYETTDAKEANADSYITYSLDNIIYEDSLEIEFPIIRIEAAIENVNATMATVFFDEPRLNSNYIVVSDLTAVIIDCSITSKYVRLVFDDNAHHVYNGETLDISYDYNDEIIAGVDGLFYFENENNDPVTLLITGNALIGTIDIDNETDAGEYTLDTDLQIVDENAVENYNLVVSSGTYLIRARGLAINYTNTLQSLQSPFSDVGYTIDKANSNLDDLDWPGMDDDPIDSLDDLLSATSFSITIDNAWRNEVFSEYEMIIGSPGSELLEITISSNNYEINYPILQITYLRIISGYIFEVSTLSDLAHLDTDNLGLKYAYEYYEIGSLPTYIQTADIDGLINGNISTLQAIRALRGNYAGSNHTIKNLLITSNEENNIGLFASIEEGTVSNLTLLNISIFSDSSLASAGGLAGTIGEDVTISGVTVYVNMVVQANYTDVISTPVSIGGLVGKSQGTILNANVVGKINVKAVRYDNLYYGGVVGFMAGGTITNVKAFMDSSVRSTISLTSNYYNGTIVGFIDTEEVDTANDITSFNYLEYSNYTYDGLNETANVNNSAFGTSSNTSSSNSFDTLYNNATISSILDTYVIRSYLFATGCDGTTTNPVLITNYRQVSLIYAYPYMVFRVLNNVYTPIALTTYHRGFIGAISYDNSSTINAYIPSTINLMDAIKSNSLVIVKKED